MLREEDAGAGVAVLAVHHLVSGGVVVDLGTSLASKRSVYFVDAFVGSMAKAEAGRAGDAVYRGSHQPTASL